MQSESGARCRTRVTASGQGPERGHDDRNSFGRLLFTASVGPHPGRLSVAFGAHDTLVVTDEEGTVHRWWLRNRAKLPGFGSSLAKNSPIRWGSRTGVAVSTTTPTVAIARGGQVTLVHFTDNGPRTDDPIELSGTEHLVWGAGQRFATYDYVKCRVTVRDFADGSIIWEPQSPSPVAKAAVDASGTTVAIANFSSRLLPEGRFNRILPVGSARKLFVVRQHDPRPVKVTIDNLEFVAGCDLGLSARGDLVVCASFTEIVVVQAATGEVLQRQPRNDRPIRHMYRVGNRPEPLICMLDARVIWLRDQRIFDVDWPAKRLRPLPPEDLYDDVAFDHANSRLAMVNSEGKVDVYE